MRPNFGCSTKEIYSRVKKITNSKFNNPKKSMFNAEYLLRQENALEGAPSKAFSCLNKYSALNIDFFGLLNLEFVIFFTLE